jgi:large subunit ribosomal protein L29
VDKTKAKDLRGLSADEFNLKKQSLEKGLNELRQKKITGQLDKPHQFKLMRRQIAQINTIEKEKRNVSTTAKK